jgi:flagellar capping protein FliD
MTNSTGNPIFRNLDAVGISLDKASAANLKTEGIDLLSFNREKFIEAYETDSTALKEMLTGDMGVLTRVESVVEQALASASGYFASAENSYRNQITRIDRQIERANVAVANYKSRLESKFAAMEKIIAGMRDQYSTFLGT